MTAATIIETNTIKDDDINATIIMIIIIIVNRACGLKSIVYNYEKIVQFYVVEFRRAMDADNWASCCEMEVKFPMTLF